MHQLSAFLPAASGVIPYAAVLMSLKMSLKGKTWING